MHHCLFCLHIYYTSLVLIFQMELRIFLCVFAKNLFSILNALAIAHFKDNQVNTFEMEFVKRSLCRCERLVGAEIASSHTEYPTIEPLVTMIK